MRLFAVHLELHVYVTPFLKSVIHHYSSDYLGKVPLS